MSNTLTSYNSEVEQYNSICTKNLIYNKNKK